MQGEKPYGKQVTASLMLAIHSFNDTWDTNYKPTLNKLINSLAETTNFQPFTELKWKCAVINTEA